MTETHNVLRGKVLRMVNMTEAALFLASDQAGTPGLPAATTSSSAAPPLPSTPPCCTPLACDAISYMCVSRADRFIS